MKNKKIISVFLAVTFALLSLLTPLACVSAKMDQATTYQESNRKESHRKMSAPGTAVPNTGYVGTVYFNTQLTASEILNLIEDLTYVQVTNNIPNQNILIANASYNLALILDYNDPELGYVNPGFIIRIVNPSTRTQIGTIVDYDEGEDLEWLYSEYEINSEVISELQGFSVGAENELIKNLFSSTPFEENPTLIETIGTGIANSAELFGAVLTNAFTALASVFITNNELTLLGTILVIAIGATVVTFAIKLILKLLQKIKV